MSIGKNEIDIVVRVQHEDRIRKLTEEIKKEEKAIIELEAALKKAGLTQEQVLQVTASTYGVSIRKMTKELNDLKLTMAQVTAQSQTMGAAMGRAGGAGAGGGGGFGRGLMQLGYMADDLQYGFSAVVNNIGPFVAGLGAGAGVAGVAQLAAVALAVLSRHVGDLRDVLEGAWLGVPAEQLARMRQAADEAAEAFEKLMALRPKAEEAARDALTGLIQENDPEKVMTDIRGGILRDKGGLNDPNLTPSDKMRAAGRAMLKSMNPFGEKSMKELLEEAKGEILKEKTEAETKRLMGNLGKHGPEGDHARQDLARLIRKDPTKFPAGLLGAIEEMDQDAANRKMGLPPQKELEAQGRLNNANYENQKRVEAIEEKKRKERLKTQEEVNRKIKHAEDEQKRKLEERLRAERNAAEQRRELKRDELQDKAEALQKDINRTRRGMTASQLEQAEDQIIGAKKPRESAVMSTKQYVDRTLTGSLNNTGKQTVDELVKQTKKLEEIRQQMKDINRLR